jgi:hypothetical protein
MNLAIVGLLAGDTADGSELLQPRYNHLAALLP